MVFRSSLARISTVFLASALMAGCGNDDSSSRDDKSVSAVRETKPAIEQSRVETSQGKAVVEQYANVAQATFEDALLTARELKTALQALVENPSDETLKNARVAWKAGRVPYQQSEVFRFGNPVVDDWEGQLNAWPLDEGLIDYVQSGRYDFELGNDGALANIVGSSELKIAGETLDLTTLTPQLLADLNELGGSEANVATGYHAIEFLLWGQDLNGTESGAGNRPFSDFSTGSDCSNGNCARRGDYLMAVADLLISDLEFMVEQWQPGSADNYRTILVSESVNQGFRKMLFGMGSLSLGELAGERMKVALEANSTEDEHDCFSDNTHNSHFYNNQGIRNVYTGSYSRVNGEVISGPSLKDLVEKENADQGAVILASFDASRSSLQKLVDSAEKNNIAFDQLIAAGNTEGNALVQSAINTLVAQTESIEQAAGLIGIQQLNPDTADHDF